MIASPNGWRVVKVGKKCINEANMSFKFTLAKAQGDLLSSPCVRPPSYVVRRQQLICYTPEITVSSDLNKECQNVCPLRSKSRSPGQIEGKIVVTF